jgi:hypothetical protein
MVSTRIRTSTVEPAPDPIQRPKLALFLWERDLGLKEAGQALGRSHEYVRRVCLPFNDPRRTFPDDEFLARVEAFTEGAVTQADFMQAVTA